LSLLFLLSTETGQTIEQKQERKYNRHRTENRRHRTKDNKTETEKTKEKKKGRQ
jgi:hypothetical protein